MRTVLVCSLAVALVGVGAPQAVAASGKYTATSVVADATWTQVSGTERTVTQLEVGSYGESYDDQSYDGVSWRLTSERYVCAPGCVLADRDVDEGVENGWIEYGRRFDRVRFQARLDDSTVVAATFIGNELLEKSSSNHGPCPRVKTERFSWGSAVDGSIGGVALGTTESSHAGRRTTHLAYPC